MSCPKHAWLFGCQEIRPGVVVVTRRCSNCGEEQAIWDDKAPASIEVAEQQMEEVRYILQKFHDHLKEIFARRWADACKTPPGLGYAFGGIGFLSLQEAFKDFGIELNL